MEYFKILMQFGIECAQQLIPTLNAIIYMAAGATLFWFGSKTRKKD